MEKHFVNGKSQLVDVLIVGGGAAGFYAGIHYAMARPNDRVLILEQSQKFLSKVKVSGGGRCNVTNHTTDPKELVRNYPRGTRELLGPFYQHGPSEVISFFESHGVPLKEEDKGRMFPESNSSSTIIALFMELVNKYAIELKPSSSVQSISKQEELWTVTTKREQFSAKKVLVASGSSSSIWKQLKAIAIPIVDPVPSLFTFKLSKHPMHQLSGLSTEVELNTITNSKKSIRSSGPLLITHQGFSGPAVLEASAWGARALHHMNYQFELCVNWMPNYSVEELREKFIELKTNSGIKTMNHVDWIPFPKRLWEYHLQNSGIQKSQQWAQLTKVQLANLINSLSNSIYKVEGKSTFKEEFVSAGGVDLKSVNFKTMESKIHPGLYFAGEVLNIDAITGGYNFQNAWTTAYIASCAMAKTT